MKQVASILLLTAFLIQGTSQLWILAAFKINQDFIAENLCTNRFDEVALCKGSCYLEKQLNEEHKQQETVPDLKTVEITLFCQDVSHDLSHDALASDIKAFFPSGNDDFVTSEYLNSVFRPPAFIA